MEDVPAEVQAQAPASDLALVQVPSITMAVPQMMVPTSEVVLHRRHDAPVHDWDLLSSGFQLEVAAYLQVVALVALVFLLKRRGKQLLAMPLWRKDEDEDKSVPPDGPGETQSGGLS